MLTVDIALFLILAFIAIVILKRLWYARDGELRIVMIIFFLSEFLADIGWITVLCFVGVKTENQMYIFFLYLPKLVAKIWFYKYILRHYKN